jgi:hypothetical protein
MSISSSFDWNIEFSKIGRFQNTMKPRRNCSDGHRIRCNSKRETVKMQHAFSIAKCAFRLAHRPVGLATALPPTVCASIRVLLAVLEHYEPAFALAGKQVPVAARMYALVHTNVSRALTRVKRRYLARTRGVRIKWGLTPRETKSLVAGNRQSHRRDGIAAAIAITVESSRE